MRINGSLSDLYGPGGFPRRESRVENTVQPARPLPDKKENKTAHIKGYINLTDTLSRREINTLQALFGSTAETGHHHYGGRNRVQGIHRGILLDVKG